MCPLLGQTLPPFHREPNRKTVTGKHNAKRNCNSCYDWKTYFILIFGFQIAKDL